MIIGTKHSVIIKNDRHTFACKIIMVAAKINAVAIVGIVELIVEFQPGIFFICSFTDWFQISTDLKPISEGTNKKYTGLELDYKFDDPNDRNRIYFRSDHFNFASKGVPIIFYYDGMLGADYHRPTDTPDKINYPLYAKRAQLVFYTAWEMANRDAMLKRDLKLEVPQRGF